MNMKTITLAAFKRAIAQQVGKSYELIATSTEDGRVKFTLPSRKLSVVRPTFFAFDSHRTAGEFSHFCYSKASDCIVTVNDDLSIFIIVDKESSQSMKYTLTH